MNLLEYSNSATKNGFRVIDANYIEFRGVRHRLQPYRASHSGLSLKQRKMRLDLMAVEI